MRSTLQRFALGLWKEARDQRGVAWALLVALPVVAFAAAWGFGDKLPQHSFAAAALYLVPLSLALYLIAIASEYFAGERRRGTLDFVRRLPGGLGWALATKLGAYVAGALFFAVWGWVVAMLVVTLFGPAQAGAELQALTFDRPEPLVQFLTLALPALGAWILLVGTWVPQGGAAALGAALLVGLIALPCVLALLDSPWLAEQAVRRLHRAPALPLLLVAAVPLLVLALSWLRGNRLLASAWAPAWRGLLLLAGFVGTSYALGAAALDRARTIDPLASDFHIESGVLGSGGRYAYVHVYQGERPWVRGLEDLRSARGTPYQPWIVDLETGTHQRAGDFHEGWLALDWVATHAPQPIVRRVDFAGENATWYDAATATARKTLPMDVRTPQVHAWEREGLAALAWQRDAQGRALWFEGDTLVREGDPLPTDLRYRRDNKGWERPIPGGWCRWEARSRGPWDLVTIEAATGRERRWVMEPHVRMQEWVSPHQLLLWRDEPVGPGSKAMRPGRWWLRDLDAPETEREVVLPAGAVLPSHVQADGRVLVLVGPDPKQPRRMALWSPFTGETTPVLDPAGLPIEGFALATNGLRARGLSLAHVSLSPESYGTTSLWIVDAPRCTAQRLAAEARAVEPLALLDARTLVAIVGRRTIVRFGPEPGAMTTLFPRR